MRHILVATALSVAALSASAQGAGTPAPAATASAPSSPAKKQLVQKMVQLLQPSTETMARSLVEQPLGQVMQQAAAVLRGNVPEDKRDAVAKAIQADLNKYVDESYPIVRDQALKIAPATIGPLLEERFTEDELRQLVGWLESPITRKYQQLAPDIQKAMGEKLVADTRSSIEPKLRAMQKSIGDRLGLPPAEAASAPAAGKGRKAVPPAPKASAAK